MTNCVDRSHECHVRLVRDHRRGCTCCACCPQVEILLVHEVRPPFLIASHVQAMAAIPLVATVFKPRSTKGRELVECASCLVGFGAEGIVYLYFRWTVLALPIAASSAEWWHCSANSDSQSQIKGGRKKNVWQSLTYKNSNRIHGYMASYRMIVKWWLFYCS